MNESLKLNEDNRTQEEINIDRVKIEADHNAIKDVIKQIEFIEQKYAACGMIISKEFLELKNKLGILVYKDWPKK